MAKRGQKQVVHIKKLDFIQLGGTWWLVYRQPESNGDDTTTFYVQSKSDENDKRYVRFLNETELFVEDGDDGWVPVYDTEPGMGKTLIVETIIGRAKTKTPGVITIELAEQSNFAKFLATCDVEHYTLSALIKPKGSW